MTVNVMLMELVMKVSWGISVICMEEVSEQKQTKGIKGREWGKHSERSLKLLMRRTNLGL